MEKLMNVENEWSDSIDANNEADAVRRIEVEEVRVQLIERKSGKQVGPLGLL